MQGPFELNLITTGRNQPRANNFDLNLFQNFCLNNVQCVHILPTPLILVHFPHWQAISALVQHQLRFSLQNISVLSIQTLSVFRICQLNMQIVFA